MYVALPIMHMVLVILHIHNDIVHVHVYTVLCMNSKSLVHVNPCIFVFNVIFMDIGIYILLINLH